MSEQTVPAEADNPVTAAQSETETESPGELESDVQVKLPELERKSEAQRHALSASKAEALRLKQENESLMARLQPVATPANDPSKFQADPQDIELFKQYAKAAGVPLAEDVKALQKSQYVAVRDEMKDKFLAEFPEYLPANDPDDAKWGALLSEISTYKEPVSPKDWYGLMTKAHKAIVPDTSFEKGKSMAKAELNLQEQTRLGGSGGSPAKKAGKTLSPDQQVAIDEFKALRPEIFG